MHSILSVRVIQVQCKLSLVLAVSRPLSIPLSRLTPRGRRPFWRLSFVFSSWHLAVVVNIWAPLTVIRVAQFCFFSVTPPNTVCTSTFFLCTLRLFMSPLLWVRYFFWFEYVERSIMTSFILSPRPIYYKDIRTIPTARPSAILSRVRRCTAYSFTRLFVPR